MQTITYDFLKKIVHTQLLSVYSKGEQIIIEIAQDAIDENVP